MSRVYKWLATTIWSKASSISHDHTFQIFTSLPPCPQCRIIFMPFSCFHVHMLSSEQTNSPPPSNLMSWPIWPFMRFQRLKSNQHTRRCPVSGYSWLCLLTLENALPHCSDVGHQICLLSFTAFFNTVPLADYPQATQKDLVQRNSWWETGRLRHFNCFMTVNWNVYSIPPLKEEPS